MRSFFGFWEGRGLTELAAFEPLHVAAWLESLEGSPATVKQRLAAVRRLFDWLILGQVLAFNPAAAVRRPRHSVTGGKTPLRTPAQCRRLLDSIPEGSPMALCDRSLIATLIYSFARIGAALAMAVAA